MKKLMKIVAILACAAILVAGSVAGTFAWLAMKTTPITNTFTAGNINIELKETTGANYKMVPGQLIKKDPTVTVKANSEACWLFVEIKKTANLATFLTYTIDDSKWTWIEGTENTDVYYCKVDASTGDQNFRVMQVIDEQGNTMKVLENVGKAIYDGVGENNKPTLTITAYAIQQVGFDTAAAAWNQAKDLSGPSSNSNYAATT